MKPGSLAVAGFAQGSLGGSLKHYQRTPKAPGSPRELGFAGWGLALRVASPQQPTHPPAIGKGLFMGRVRWDCAERSPVWVFFACCTAKSANNKHGRPCSLFFNEL